MASLVIVPPSTALSQVDATDEARTLFIAGSNLARMGDWQGALVQYRASLAHKRAPITLFSLALTEENLGLFVEARDDYKAFLAESSTPFTAPYEGPARASLRRLEGQLGHIEVVVLPVGLGGVRLALDGRAPSGETASYDVNPGEHVLVASAPGAAPTRVTVDVAEGATVRATLRLTPLPLSGKTLAPANTPELRPSTDPTGSRSHTLPTVLLVGGGALFAAGATVGILGIRAAGDAPTSEGTEAQAARAQMLAGDILGGVGLAAVGAGLVVQLWPESEAESATRTARVRPWLGAGAAGLEGRF